MDISAYIEKRNADGKWELVSDRPICSSLKYIVDDWSDLSILKWDDLSEGMKAIYRKDKSGQVYSSFRMATLSYMEGVVESMVREAYTKINVILKALGAETVYSDDGEELCVGDESKERLTFPVNRELLVDLQWQIDRIRHAGQREAFDMILNSQMHWDGDSHRVVFVSD